MIRGEPMKQKQSGKFAPGAQNSGPKGEPLSREEEALRQWVKTVRFKPSVIGGVQEADVWKKIAELNELYEAALVAERARYDALLKDRINLVARQMAKNMVEQAMAKSRQEQGDEAEF